MLPFKTRLIDINSSKLSEIYDTLYGLQQRLGIDEERMLNISRDLNDDEHVVALNKLLEALIVTRDNLITWYLRQTRVELNVTVSLITAKIKLIQYKLNQCDGLDLHQACSLSLVDFSNILASRTILNVKPSDRKTLHQVSKEVGIPIWLSHYRNQICHIPSESPRISILVPLVAKSLNYMKDYFWSRLIERDNFDVQRCSKIVKMIASFTNIKSKDNHMVLRSEKSLSKTKLKQGKKDLVKGQKACFALRRILLLNPEQTLDIVIDFMTKHTLRRTDKNCSLLFEQVIIAKKFERFVIKLLNLAEEQPSNKKIISWIKNSTFLIFFRKPAKLEQMFSKLNLNPSKKMKSLTNIPDVKCCHIFLRLIRLDNPLIDKIVLLIRNRLCKILGPERTMLFVELNEIAKRPINVVKKRI